jgi:hypothetical protein
VTDPTPIPVRGAETPEAARARRMRNLALGGALLLFVALVFVITMVKMSAASHAHAL